MLKRKDLLGIEDLSSEEILEILDTAESFQEVSTRPIKKVPTLRGKSVINLFFEASTRTRTSFEIAGKRLSADVVNLSLSNLYLLTKFQSHVWLCSTPTLMPPGVEKMVCDNNEFVHVTHSMDEAI